MVFVKIRKVDSEAGADILAKIYLAYMFSFAAWIKIGLVFCVCVSMAYIHYLFFTSVDFIAAVKASAILYASGMVYLFVIVLFADFYWKQQRHLVLATWLMLNLSFIVNFSVHLSGNFPPLYLQYSQSTSLLIFAILLAVTRAQFPNWLRLFSLSCLLVLIPCLIYYFSENRTYYEYCVYALCFTPVIKSFVFLKEIPVVNDELIDAD